MVYSYYLERKGELTHARIHTRTLSLYRYRCGQKQLHSFGSSGKVLLDLIGFLRLSHDRRTLWRLCVSRPHSMKCQCRERECVCVGDKGSIMWHVKGKRQSECFKKCKSTRSLERCHMRVPGHMIKHKVTVCGVCVWVCVCDMLVITKPVHYLKSEMK